MNNVELFQSIQKLSEAEIAARLSQIKFSNPVEGKTAAQILYEEEIIKTAIPTLLAIRTPDEESKELVRQINKKLLPTKTDQTVDRESILKRKFRFKGSNNTMYFDMVCTKATRSEFELLLKNQMIAFASNNNILSSIVNNLYDFFDIYFVRKKGQDGRWYLMLHVDMKG